MIPIIVNYTLFKFKKRKFLTLIYGLDFITDMVFVMFIAITILIAVTLSISFVFINPFSIWLLMAAVVINLNSYKFQHFVLELLNDDWFQVTIDEYVKIYRHQLKERQRKLIIFSILLIVVNSNTSELVAILMAVHVIYKHTSELLRYHNERKLSTI